MFPTSTRGALSRQKRRAKIGRLSPSAEVRIDSPERGAPVNETGIVEGIATIPPGASLWVLVRREGAARWWPQGNGPVPVNQGRWQASVKYGEKHDTGHAFEICAIAVRHATEELWRRWVERAVAGDPAAPVSLPAAEFVVAEYLLRVRKTRLAPD